jgi:hypothetical protein
VARTVELALKSRSSLLSIPVISFVFCACAHSQVQDLEVVDCSLPGQVRIVGGRVYNTPRRPTRTTAEDCRTRGGEYLSYDRADYRTALAVWLETAEGGDAAAQNTIGEIYEKGLGGDPNPTAAAQWYRRAAEQGYARAQFNLGTLYEQGLGVEHDMLEALNWYRRASGLDADDLMFRSRAAEETAQVRDELQAEIQEKNRRIEALGRRITELEQAPDPEPTHEAEREALVDVVDELRVELAASQEQLISLPTAPGPGEDGEDGLGGHFRDAEERTYRQRDLGRYYALIIGVQSYPVLDENVPSALSDTERIAEVLDERYGFRVSMLSNPTQRLVAETINELSKELTDEDNLLIYFAGIGERLRSGPREDGYWLPTDAQPAPNDTLWVSNEFITRHLGRLEAKRVLVVSDASYTGMLSTEPGQLVVRERSYSDAYIEWKLPMRARLLLSSGTDRPVERGLSGEHSVFAEAFITELESSQQLLTAPELHLRIRDRINGLGLTPELKSIKAAGHEVGDFFFVPGS